MAKSAQSAELNQNAWNLAKSYYAVTDAKMSKDEKANLYRGVHDLLIRYGFNESVANSAQKWAYK